MKKYLPLIFILALACPGPGKVKERVKKLSLDDIAGGYTVEGTNPDGSQYQASMIIRNDGGILRVSGSIEATGQSFKGIGLMMDDVVAISYTIELPDKPGEQGDLNLIVYKVRIDGTLEGNWSYEGGSGKEVAKKIK